MGLKPFSTRRIYSREVNFSRRKKFDRTRFCFPQKLGRVLFFDAKSFSKIAAVNC